MRISTDIAWLLTTALVALRLGVALLVTPLLAFGGVPARFRAILVLSLAALLVSATGARPAGEVHDVAAFAGMAASETVLGALRQMREEDRLVIAYRYFFDLSEAEMSDALGVARGTVKSRLSRALVRLRALIGEAPADE